MRESFFRRLYKKEKVKEDFITEVLAGILTSLKAHSMEKFSELFRELNFPPLPFNNPSIETQKISASGRNDLVIRDDNITIIFENKWDSQTYLEQLRRYDNELSKEDKNFRFLVHLTKDYEEIKEEFISSFKKINWSDLYKALKSLNLIDKYLINQFLFFLEEEGIAMEKISWEIVNGAKSVYNLTRIIYRACQELGVKCIWSPTSADYTSQWIDNRLGAYFLLDKGYLIFTSPNPQPNIPEMNIQWKNNYCIKFDFDKHFFFHRDLEGQVELIKGFVKDLLSRMETK
jgi:hypothetical protein